MKWTQPQRLRQCSTAGYGLVDLVAEQACLCIHTEIVGVVSAAAATSAAATVGEVLAIQHQPGPQLWKKQSGSCVPLLPPPAAATVGAVLWCTRSALATS